MDWQVEIVQDDTVLKMDHEIRLNKGPFTIRVKLPKPMTVQLNILGDDRNFQSVKAGLSLDYSGEMHCFLPGTGMAEARYDHSSSPSSLTLRKNGHHYLYYNNGADHRWNNVSMSYSETIFERYVHNLTLLLDEFTALEGNHLYLIFLVKHRIEEKIIYADELKKIVLTFT